MSPKHYEMIQSFDFLTTKELLLVQSGYIQTDPWVIIREILKVHTTVVRKSKELVL
jgi:hypothetical protein